MIKITFDPETRTATVEDGDGLYHFEHVACQGSWKSGEHKFFLILGDCPIEATFKPAEPAPVIIGNHQRCKFLSSVE